MLKRLEVRFEKWLNFHELNETTERSCATMEKNIFTGDWDIATSG